MTTAKTRWIRVTTCDQIPLREGRALRVGALDLALFNLGDQRFLAVDGRCPHQGGPLYDGIVSGNTVVCPLHAWKVNLVDGAVERPASVKACVHTYATKVTDDTVWMEVPASACGDGQAA